MILTERLEVKPWAESDAESFFELTQDSGFNLYPITHYRQSSVASALQWICASNVVFQETGLGKWGVWEKARRTLVGMGGLSGWNLEGESLVDMTYRLRESAWGMGYGLELAQALRQHAFDYLKMPEITATITPDNVISQKIAKKLGMSFDRKIILLGVETDLFRIHRER